MSARTYLGSPLNVADQGAYENTFLHASELNWEPVQGEKGATGLTAMPKGLLRAVLFGDPNLPGLCMFRMKYPPNYRVPPHFHWMAEHTSVLEGEAYFGLGDTFDESKLIKWNAGDYFTVSAGRASAPIGRACQFPDRNHGFERESLSSARTRQAQEEGESEAASP